MPNRLRKLRLRKKFFMTMTPGPNVIKLFTAVPCEFSTKRNGVFVSALWQAFLTKFNIWSKAGAFYLQGAPSRVGSRPYPQKLD
jgi:hypothetical protein